MIDGIVPEPAGGAQNDWKEAARLLKEALARGAGRPRGLLRRGARPPSAGEVPRDGRLRVTTPLFLGYSTLSTGFSPAGDPGFPTVSTRFATQDRHRFATQVFGRTVATGGAAATWPRTAASAIPSADAGAVRAPARAARTARSRSSSSSGTTPGGSTTTSGSSATARSRAGRCRRACRSSRASARSPSTSRTTRSTTRPSRARSRRATTAPGTVEIWDSGTYELVEEKKDGGLTVRLHGKRLEGLWTLDPGEARRRPEELADAQEARRAATRRATSSGRRYEPMLATLDEDVPKGEGWLFEVKWDGYRALAYVRGGEADARQPQRQRPDRALRRRREGAAAKALKTPDCVLDGEVCALDEDGRPSFSAMQQGKPGTPIVYEAFDLLEVEGEPLVDLPLRERRARLEQLLDRRNTTVRLSEAFDDGDALLRGGRGSSGSRGSSRSGPTRRTGRARRTRDWLKIKTHGRQEFVIAGYTKGQGRRVGPLRLARARRLARRRARLRRQRRHRLHRQGDRRAAREAAAARAEGAARSRSCRRCRRCARRDVVWVKPGARLRGRVRRVDARRPAAGAVVPGAARGQDRAGGPPRGAAADRAARRASRALKLSNLDKVFFPDDGITKGDLLAYYRAVAPVLAAAPQGPAVHDEALSRRDRRAATSSRRTRRSTCRTGSRRREFEVSTRESPRQRQEDPVRRSSTTSWRCSGW